LSSHEYDIMNLRINIQTMKKLNSLTLGLIQSLVVFAYCFLVGILFMYGDSIFTGEKAAFVGIAMVLVLLVFSAAIMGLVVFGYPIYFFIQKNIKKALATVGYTVMFTFIWFLVLLVIVIFI